MTPFPVTRTLDREALVFLAVLGALAILVPLLNLALPQTSLFSLSSYTVATFGKFSLGFWLALLLNNHFPFKSIIRAIVLLPWIVPTVLSAIAFWWIYDPQFSIISYLLVEVLHWRTTNIDFLGSALSCSLPSRRYARRARRKPRPITP